MNNLAHELNTRIAGTVVERVMSDLGRRIFFPKGIVAQAAEAKERAHRHNATVGMAYHRGSPMTLPAIQELTPDLTTAETVAYAPTTGVMALRKRWHEEMIRKNPDLVGVRTTLPVVVPGLTAGLSLIADLIADEDNMLLLPDLFWGNYRLTFAERRLCSIREFNFFDDNGNFNIESFAEAARAASSGGKLIVMLNFPNNPAGFTPRPAEVEQIRKTLVTIAASVPVVVIADDAYFGLNYSDDVYQQSIFAVLAHAHPNILAIKVDGATKEDFVWGFRVGFVTFSFQGMTEDQAAVLETKMAGLIRSVFSSSSTLGQSILLRALSHKDYEAQKAAARKILTERFIQMQEILEAKQETYRAQALEPLPCNSGYFMSFRCLGLNAEDLRLELLERGIGTISVKDQFLRVAYAGVDKEGLPELFEEIFTAAEKLSTP